MNFFKRMKLELEAANFGFKMGKQLSMDNPLMPVREIQARVSLAWCDHLVETGRGKLIKDKAKDSIALLRKQIKDADTKRNNCGIDIPAWLKYKGI